ncbi:immunoglobulin superfamily member 1-like [Pelobates fuscus]|uniref:immunoglobulin superfamily member 1-like n=1 Tax=Pelobates fuscus TaxID=191477 RepID=UPI002FE48D73
MRYFASYLGTITCFVLLFKQVSGNLPKPLFTKYVKDDSSRNEIMVGDTVIAKCETASPKAVTFYLRYTKGMVTTWVNQTADPTFTFANIKKDQSGNYICLYCNQSTCSEPSDRVYIYVRDEYPQPKISVSPRKILLPDESAIITCSTHFSNITFSLYKDKVKIMNYPSGQKTVSYHIDKATTSDNGEYNCIFQRTLDDSQTLVSSMSNPTLLRVKDLPKPTITDEDDNSRNKIRFYCIAPSMEQMLSFQLLSERKGIESQIRATNAKNATFIIDRPKHTTQYFCKYYITMDFDMAYSRRSDGKIIKGIDYTTINVIRLLIAALVLILLGGILWKESNNFKTSQEDLPKLPSARGKSTRISKATDVICQSGLLNESML